MRFYGNFEVNEFTGEPMTAAQVGELHCKKIQALQATCFAHFKDTMKELAMATISSIESRSSLTRSLSKLNSPMLINLAVRTTLLPAEFLSETAKENPNINPLFFDQEFVMEILIDYFEKRISQLDQINAEPIYPNEETLWSQSLLDNEYSSFEHPLPLPKLNLQFLTFYDYLLRNYELYRLESTFEIRNDIESTVKRLLPKQSDGAGSQTVLKGFAKMALPVREFKLIRVHPPRVGHREPSRVRAEVRVSLGDCKNNNWKGEWDELRQHDAVFLVSIRARPEVQGNEAKLLQSGEPFLNVYDIAAVRGCAVTDVADETGETISEYDLLYGEKKRKGNMRTFRVDLDPSQYLADVDADNTNIYSSFTVVVRRKVEANNFKAVLDTIRMLMNDELDSIPQWAHDTVLGYGVPTEEGEDDDDDEMGKENVLNFYDTFISKEHLEMSFLGKKITFNCDNLEDNHPPFKLVFKKDEIFVTPIKQELDRLLPPPPRNSVPFTPTQVMAIKNGLREGLTLIVGPPGTGKTDVAVQLASNLYHTYPNQRILLLTHSNTALNHLFDKLIEREVPEQHCLRLGHGERQLETIKDFSRRGRVNYLLALRLSRLANVEELSRSLGVWREGSANTCETAPHLNHFTITPKWNKFITDAQKIETELVEKGKEIDEARRKEINEFIPKNFPFTVYFNEFFKFSQGENAQPLFGEDFVKDFATAQNYYLSIQNIFKDLEECAPFELFRTPKERGIYLQTTQARIIAMTVTHAALKHEELRGGKLNAFEEEGIDFRYDTIIMEEAGQVLELETVIPMLLQKLTLNSVDSVESRESRLRRIVLIGDDRQLPPVVQSTPLKAYSHLDQSMFGRLIRLGVPYTTLDKQGRCRPQLTKLFSWKYPGLGDLENVIKDNVTYQKANGGFAFCTQCIDIPNGVESAPTPHYYQNLDEAEYIVQLYMFMRLLGYPANKISILTTYNGQRALIRDIIARRCGTFHYNPNSQNQHGVDNRHKLFGPPAQVSTVDKFQGQQNDFVLLSLVRTRSVGHLRDVRRLIVAISRAKLGLYVVCNKQLFDNCLELTPTFSQFQKIPSQLALVQNELFGTNRLIESIPSQVYLVNDTGHLAQLVSGASVAVLKRIEKEDEEIHKHNLEMERVISEQIAQKVHENEVARMEKERQEKEEEAKKAAETGDNVLDNLDESAFAEPEDGDVKME
jgi:intron-binding protein aquarius